MMPKFFDRFLLILLLVGSSLTFFSCGDDGDFDESNPMSGTWYLVTYDEYTCDWGEYMRFSGSTVHWNKRSGGSRNTSYTLEKASSGFKCSNSEEQYVFSISAFSGSTMVTYSSDGIVRSWKR